MPTVHTYLFHREQRYIHTYLTNSFSLTLSPPLRTTLLPFVSFRSDLFRSVPSSAVPSRPVPSRPVPFRSVPFCLIPFHSRLHLLLFLFLFLFLRPSPSLYSPSYFQDTTWITLSDASNLREGYASRRSVPTKRTSRLFPSEMNQIQYVSNM